jgi:hypothetical protein
MLLTLLLDAHYLWPEGERAIRNYLVLTGLVVAVVVGRLVWLLLREWWRAGKASLLLVVTLLLAYGGYFLVLIGVIRAY